MAVAHFDSFSSPMRDSFPPEDQESPSPVGADLDGHVLEDLDLRHEATRGDHLEPPDAIIEVEPAPEGLPLPTVVETDRCAQVEKTSRTCSCWKTSMSHIVAFLTVCCFVFVTATVACRLAIGKSPTEPAIIFTVTCITVAVGIWGIIARSQGLTMGYGCLLVILTVTTIICGSLEAERFTEEFAALQELNGKPSLTPDDEQQVKDISESLKILAAFVALYFLCAALVLVTSILTFKLPRNLAEKERESKLGDAQENHDEAKKAQVTQGTNRCEDDKQKETPSSADANIPLAPPPVVDPTAITDDAEGGEPNEN
ncbi:conserved hypothetical protein [Neospora caninum Liverpool]|uniref:Transmembrane protein n=1 Tax=Neospora caninum (strain Liverpool) TaxID=572307 RepID=F0VG25_NEOCL|nr:conserved hypothetical protein [Neospora caninum Liverpool]CBZ52669.1 conserved hypothetical protein [Neospora caninum Liverpool]CEL66646.1 TPA: hypothetical protein BN1204_024570 [Neospora caninum Liverpool]|eukprot:XP_003882701.1 conserved hypothetical protein [Neospora caninum Liverpool]